MKKILLEIILSSFKKQYILITENDPSQTLILCLFKVESIKKGVQHKVTTIVGLENYRLLQVFSFFAL